MSALPLDARMWSEFVGRLAGETNMFISLSRQSCRDAY
jgi:hypothetical protein